MGVSASFVSDGREGRAGLLFGLFQQQGNSRYLLTYIHKKLKALKFIAKNKQKKQLKCSDTLIQPSSFSSTLLGQSQGGIVLNIKLSMTALSQTVY